MIRKVSITRSQTGKTVVRVNLRDGDLTSSYSVVVWSKISEALLSADRGALNYLRELKGAE